MLSRNTLMTTPSLSDVSNKKGKGDRSSYSSEHGSLYVEAALTIPIVLALLFGVIEFGSLTTQKAILSDTVRKAARTLAAQPFPSAAETPDFFQKGENLVISELAKFSIPENRIRVELNPREQEIHGVDRMYLDITASVDIPCKTCSKFAGINLKLFTIESNSRVLMEDQ